MYTRIEVGFVEQIAVMEVMSMMVKPGAKILVGRLEKWHEIN